ncbi:PREDICTED: testis-expressed sequence 101 protein isoform X2 [Chinchilla lanigera]|uniref:testis-expressed sequence 101 protein isoform X2 n=1 Tax=Chinchilla lanigera TaxID=34839 RepID=UPI000695B403|nr:PREDICTED: testis-expressed sequence 101 protein isoform X2 [Chinchilla lanigera]
MGRFQDLLLLFLLGCASLTMAQNLLCHKGVFTTLLDDPRNSSNWTGGEVETCDKGALCQETILMIIAGEKTAILATKGCISEKTESVTFIQHSPPPGLVAVSYTNYCESPLCNKRESIASFWKPEVTTAPSVRTLHCPTCVAQGTCFNAPLLPCPHGTTRCYQGKLNFSGGGINSSLEVKGCTATAGCRLMARISEVGPISMTEVCPRQLQAQARKAASGASWFPVSVWRLTLRLSLLLQSLVLFF